MALIVRLPLHCSGPLNHLTDLLNAVQLLSVLIESLSLREHGSKKSSTNHDEYGGAFKNVVLCLVFCLRETIERKRFCSLIYGPIFHMTLITLRLVEPASSSASERPSLHIGVSG